MSEVWGAFSQPMQAWFAETFGEPTPPQAQGWPPIQRGEHTLILAPTGSGKTLAAFLWGIDQLFRELAEVQKPEASGIRILYISPLKALNNDIQRNLRLPLAGLRKKAQQLGLDIPDIEVAVRSGDTPVRQRQAMLNHPPHILITTPESLYLMLTSSRAREMLRGVRRVIVDEIHTLVGDKRGVHLSLSLERLQHLASHPIQRIGLSATIKPLDEVARFLGGNEWADGALRPRPVTVVDAGYRKPLELQVETAVEDFRHLPGDSIWPAIVPRLAALIRQHRTMLVFANNRRLAERTADWLNEQLAAEAAGRGAGMVEGGTVKGLGMTVAGRGLHAGPVRVHHGSLAKEVRLEMERALKAGQLPALVGTASLELGIDIGAVDLVVQLQSPKSVAHGLQRVGRSGHLVGQTSRGRIFPTYPDDLMEAAAIAGGMLRGEVEPTYTPRHPLDVLAQQIVAMVSVDAWSVDDLFNLVRCAYAYEDLTPAVYRGVLDMLAGRYPSQAHGELRPRVSWDRVNQRLAALPGSRLLAVTSGGTIADRGAFGAYLTDGKTRLGELDEEFVYETRLGDAFVLGSQVWRVTDITDDRVMVAPAPGSVPRMPFWRGDYPWRPYQIGQLVGRTRRLVAERLRGLQAGLGVSTCREVGQHADQPEVQATLAWLRQEYALDDRSAWQVMDYVAGQLDAAGAMASDRTVVVEVFDDALGDPRMVIHSPFGGRVNGPWGLALAGALREHTGVSVEVQTNDDGILLRFPESDAEFPLDAVSRMGPAEARERVLSELPDSAVFGARFRQNAARSLLLPGLRRGGRRTPFWLQRLRARDLLQIVRQFPDFPIVAETVRDCLQDVMDLPHLMEVLADIQSGAIQLVVVESLTPSPVAQGLLWQFTSVYMYEWDAPKAERQLQTLAINRDLLQDLLTDVALDELLRPEAIAEVAGRLQHTLPATRARTAEELSILFQELGDLSASELSERSAADPAQWLAQLAAQDRILELLIPTARGLQRRWVAAEVAGEYAAAFGLNHADSERMEPDAARRRILERWLRAAGTVTLAGIQERYAFPTAWLQGELDRLAAGRQLARGRFTPRPRAGSLDSRVRPATVRQEVPASDAEYVDRHTLEQIHRHTLTILRREVQPVPFDSYADFLTHWQHLYSGSRLGGRGALNQVLQQLSAAPVVGQVWERDVLALRLKHYDPAELEALCQNGELVWVGSGGADPRRGRVCFLFRGEGSWCLGPPPQDLSWLSPPARRVYDYLGGEGAAFFGELCAGLELAEPEAERGLLELVMAGLVTNDSWQAMRRILHRTGGSPAGSVEERKPFGALEQQLAERRGASPALAFGRRPSRTAYLAAARRVRQRLEPVSAPAWPGRWALVHRPGIIGKPASAEDRANRQTRQLLMRFGVVTRECVKHEETGWDWEVLYQQLRRMEMRGEVRRGYFVQELPGIQFALPEAVENLRSVHGRRLEDDTDQLVVLNACDPANLRRPAPDQPAGAPDDEPTTFPPDSAVTFARVPSTWLLQRRGRPVLIVEAGGASLRTAPAVDAVTIQQALAAWLAHAASFARRVTVASWNGAPVLGGAGQPLLEAAGLFRDYPGMTWERA